MLFINEWLPNPAGSDAAGEFIELRNDGGPLALAGWAIGTGTGKRFRLSGRMTAGGLLVLPRRITKLALKNTDGELFLYAPSGAVADFSFFAGSAPEGESLNRVPGTAAGNLRRGVQNFVWGIPTPGRKNDPVPAMGISDQPYPFGVPLGASGPDTVAIFGMSLCVGVIFAVALWYAITKDEKRAQLFSGGNQGDRA